MYVATQIRILLLIYNTHIRMALRLLDQSREERVPVRENAPLHPPRRDTSLLTTYWSEFIDNLLVQTQ